MTLGAALEHPKYAVGALALGLTVDLGRRLWTAGTSAYDAYKHPENRQKDQQQIADVLSPAALKYPAELGLAAAAGIAFGHYGKGMLATKLERLPRVSPGPQVGQSGLQIAAEMPDPIIRRDFNFAFAHDKPSTAETAGETEEGPKLAPDRPLSPLQARARQQRIMQQVYGGKYSSDENIVAIPVFQGDELSMEPTIIHGDRNSGLGRFYLETRKPTAQVLSITSTPDPGRIGLHTGSSFFIEGEPGKSVFGVSNKHVFSGSDLVVIKTSGRRVFLADVVAVDHDADIVLYKPVPTPDEQLAKVADRLPDVVSGDPCDLPFFKLAASGATPRNSFVCTINHVAGMEQDVLSMGQAKGTFFSKSRANNPEGRLIARVTTNATTAGGGSGGELVNESGEVTAVLDSVVGRASLATRVEHLRAMRDLVLQVPPPTGHYWNVATTFDQSTGIVKVSRLDSATDRRLGGSMGAPDIDLIFQDSETETFVHEQNELGRKIFENRQRIDAEMQRRKH
jgi:S1-C subfamily serine protease